MLQVGWEAGVARQIGLKVSKAFHGDISAAWHELSQGKPSMDAAMMRHALKKYAASKMPLDDWRALSIFMQRCAGRRNIPKGSEFIDQLAFCKALEQHDHLEALVRKLRDNIAQRGGTQQVLQSMVDAQHNLHRSHWVSGKYRSGIGPFIQSELEDIWRALAGGRSELSANDFLQLVGESKSPPVGQTLD